MIGKEDPTDAMEARALSYAPNHIDIYSNSWGPADTGWDIGGPATITKEALKEGTTRVSKVRYICRSISNPSIHS